MDNKAKQEQATHPQRALWMQELAQSSLKTLQALAATVSSWPDYQVLEGPAIGTILIHGPIAGNGGTFPVGDCTITRCRVQDSHGHEGFSWILGQQPEIALWAARWDALLQNPEQLAVHWDTSIRQLRQERRQREQDTVSTMQKTQVRFFSMENMRT
ncbi:phosphonate C-P lyase system protein PhnG [Acidithiobacillus marinus]|uniref:Phosphonate C-P lyase system protein PhnG n=1 Tax=Acidithiobacillus marinus TaxID=187490 RepID=A0A2I1DMR1_9PROT|nr:phosphonate C-P lyase system protein PhnG [Acidithiobacillus marinus]PKY11157.1 phosphonate C-P lyase system protein PhnG [Acidithiobacillus marinus]